MNKNELKLMDNKQINKKITMDEFIQKALERKTNRKSEEEINIPGYGLITFKRPTDEQSLEYLNNSAKAIKVDKEGNVFETNLIILNEAAKEFIYFTCPYLQNTDLQETLGIKDPFDTPAEVFGSENLADIAAMIQEKFSDNDGMKIKKAIKN
jgi:hypothetical protein